MGCHMKITELKENILISEWLDNLNAAANTEETYLHAMQAFIDFTGMTPEELIDEAETESRLGILMRHRKIKRHFIGFRKYLQDKGLADFSVKSRMTGVRSFYNSFELELPKLQGEKRKARVKEGNKTIPKKEDLQEALKVCDPLEKAVLLVGVSSGLASNEISNLTIDQFKNGFDVNTGITTLEITRGKTGVDHVTYMSPEASAAVIEYLKFRERGAKAATTRREKQLEKQKIISGDGYLFILRQFSDEFLVTHDDKIRQLTRDSIQKLFRSIADKANKNTKCGIYNFIRSHTMRKYFNSVLLNAGCDSFHSEFFMGHALDDTRGAYFRASPDKLKEVYKKYIPYLTIQKELDLSESPEYQAIKSENDILRAETAKHIVERQEIINLKNEVAKGTIEREELNALRNEIDALYREIRTTPEGYKVGTRLVQKIHPHRLILQPDDGTEVDPEL